MQLTLQKNELMDALNTVTRALSARPANHALEGVLIETEDELIRLTCSDGNMTITSDLNCAVKEDGSVVLPGRLFTELVRKLQGDEVNLGVDDSYRATIRCSRARSNMSGISGGEYPDIAQVSDGMTFEVPMKKLREMISHVEFACATDESRQILTGCLMEITPNEMRMVALDGFRMAVQIMQGQYDVGENGKFTAVIPSRALREIARTLPDSEEKCTLTFNKTHMKAAFGNTTVSTVLLAGTFIDYRRILPDSFTTQATVNRESVINAIELASLMAREGKNNIIRLSFHEDMLSISSNAENGNTHDDMDASIDGADIDIAFNAKYILDVVRNVEDAQVIMSFNTNVSPCIIRPSQGEESIYLVLPVRVFQ